MADDILKAYLISIGFKIDEQDYKKFKDAQLDTEKRTKNLSKAFADFAKIGIGSAVTLGTAVIKVSNDLENLYFQSKRAGTTAKNLKSFGEAAENIGIQSEEAMGLVEKLNAQIAANPLGEGSFLSFLGLDAKEDKTKLMLDLVDKLANVKDINVRNAYGSHFGLNAVQLQTLINGRGDLNKTFNERLGVNSDLDAQAKAAHDAEIEFRKLEASYMALANTVGTAFLPAAKDIVSILDVVVKDLIEADHYTAGWSSRVIGLGAALTGTVGALKAFGLLKGLGSGGSVGAGAVAGVASAGLIGGALANWGINIAADTYDIKAKEGFDSVANSNRNEVALARLYKQETGLNPEDNYLAYTAWKKKRFSAKKSGFDPAIDNFLLRHPTSGSAGKANVSSLLDKYAGIYGIDPALLHAQAYQESRLNPNALSPKGAIGIMQLMPLTAKGLGVNPYDTESNIEGGARMMQGLLKKYGGNTSLALAAYNAGEGRVDRAGGIPNIAETQDYVASIQRRMAGDAASKKSVVMLNQDTDIHVNGSGDPHKAADLVAAQQSKLNSNLARNFAGATQ